MFDVMFSAKGLIGLFTLVLLEIILGIDNIIFIAILCSFIQNKEQQRKARTIGLMLALLMRAVLLFAIFWIVNLTETLFTISSYVSDFINKYPTIKMLALAFLVVIGIMLLLDSLHVSIPKGYIYVGLGFSLIVEMLNIRFRKIQHKAL